jgi:hypothetical protein
MSRVRAALVATFSAIAVAGCTVVNIHGAAPQTRVVTGVLRLAPADGARLVTYSAEGLGLVPGRNGATLGWAREKTALLFDDSCRIVILELPSDREAIERWRTILARGDMCIAGGETAWKDLVKP